MYQFDEYTFDSRRLLVYKSDVESKALEFFLLNYDKDHNKRVPQDISVDANHMQMNKIAIAKAGICLTYNCNLRCKYCGYSSDEKSQYSLQFEDVELFVKDIIKRKTIRKLITHENVPLEIVFTGGGEPTYDWPLFEKTVTLIRSMCTENAVPVVLKLTTNGMLSDSQISFISKYFNHIMVSYDGLPEIQNRNRICPHNKDTASVVETTIRKFVNNRIPLTVRSTVWQDDFDKLKKMYNHVSSIVSYNGAVTWSIYPVMFEGRAVANIKQQGRTVYADFIGVYAKLLQEITPNNETLKIEVPLLENSVCDIYCGAHRIDQPWLMPDKSVVTCIESKDNKTIIGNVGSAEIEYSKNYQDILLHMIQKKYVECADCIAYGTCKGGCPIWHFRVDHTMQEPLECCLQKEYWKRIIGSLIKGEYAFGWKLKRLDTATAESFDIYQVVKEEN